MAALTPIIATKPDDQGLTQRLIVSELGSAFGQRSAIHKASAAREKRANDRVP